MHALSSVIEDFSFIDKSNLDQLKVFQYLGNVRRNSVVPGASVVVLKVTIHTELAWYSPSATQRIFLYGLEHGLGIQGFFAYLTLPDFLNHLVTVLWSTALSPLA